MAEKISAVKGMNDLLPEQTGRWEWLEAKFRSVMQTYAYQNIRTPIVEPTALFVRGLGEVTDIVEKEMYSFEDKMNGEHLTLRPESTAGVVRAVVEHNLLYEGGRRLYYMGPMFRHERPQRGRYRQFHQLGAEALGFSGPEVDAELILMAHAFWKSLGLQHVRLELNSLGQPDERLRHRSDLIVYLEKNLHLLDDDAKRRLHTNPLRVLDTKNPAMQELAQCAPQLLNYLGDASQAHFNAVKNILDAQGVAYSINPRLVRGMDYYNLTVFEFITEQLGSQGTICGGGRYDYLIEQIGGKPAPAVGWALGAERVLELLKEQNAPHHAPAIDAYAIVPDAASLPQVIQTIEQLRQMGVRIQMHSPAHSATGSGMGSLKSQFKKADASGALHALIFGEQELSNQQVTIKSLRDGEGEQRLVHLNELPLWGPALQSQSS